jgi:p-cymene methyl-monooxygenase electron transfer component
MGILDLFQAKAKSRTVLIRPDEVAIPVARGVTILDAALAAGLSFPYSCRVGSCGTCRCVMISGRVKRYTDFGYVLDQTALDAGTILACQSEAVADLVIALDRPLATYGRQRNLRGAILALDRVADDVISLNVGLDTLLNFAAGQTAELIAPSGIRRPYSFASAPQEGGDTILHFHIRREVGGRFTQWLFESSAIGDEIGLVGPSGNFGYRPSSRGIVCVAGGTGYAPLHAVLTDATTVEHASTAHLIVAARDLKSHYAKPENLAAIWRQRLTSETILSAAPASGWEGAIGFAHEALGRFLTRHGQDYDIYVAGPPVMVDACRSVATALGVPHAQVHCDSFIPVNRSSSVQDGGQQR